MVIHRVIKRGLALFSLVVIPTLLLAQAPQVTSLQSAAGNPEGFPVAPTQGNAITAGTPDQVIQLFVNGTFHPQTSSAAVNWTENNISTPLTVIGTSNNQLVANVPQNLFAAAGSAAITVTETIFGDVPSSVTSVCQPNSPNSPTCTFTVNPAMAQVALPSGIVGAAYSQNFFTGGTGPFTVQFASNPAPPGLGATAGTGNPLSGTPTQAGTFTVNPTITDTWGNAFVPNETLTVVTRLIITTPNLPAGTAQHAYNATVSANGGVAPYSWSATGLPANLTINQNSGVISGTPTSAGTFPVSVSVSDSGGQGALANYSLQIVAVLSITTGALPSGTVQQAYSATVSAAGGSAPYTWSAAGLPANLAINQNSGVISGTPTSAGTFPVTVSVSDSGGQGAQANYSLQIVAVLTITTGALPSGTFQQAYSATVSAAGGSAPYTWSAVGLPANLTINQNSGVISGTPTSAGTFPVTVSVSDSGGQGAQANFSLQIVAVLTITTGALPSGSVQQAYSATVSAAGGSAPYTWSANGLPAGLSINPNTGAISGAPTVSGTFSVTVHVLDTRQQTAQSTYSVSISQVLTITTTGLPPGMVLQGYSGTVSAIGGVPPYTWSASGLPGGLNMNPSTGGISGSPLSSGTFPVTVHVSDSSGENAQAVLNLLINPAPPPPLQITTQSLQGGTAGQLYAALIAASGGSGGYTFSVTGGSLPPGVQLAFAGQIFGTPTSSGIFSFTVQVTDSSQNISSRAFSIQILPGVLTLTGAPPATVALNASLSVKFSVTGGVAPYVFTLGGTAPTGTSFANGTLSGTATTPGTFSFTITATDSQTPTATASQSFTIVVTPAPLAISASLPGGQVGQAYAGQITVTGGVGPFTFSGSAGGGLSVSSNGAVSGTPTSPGTVSISVTVTDKTGATASGTFPVTIAPPAVTITTSSLPSGALTSAYSTPLGASGGTLPYTWSATGLPNGLSISPAGIINGTPIAPGTFTVNVTLKDFTGLTATAALTLTINPAPLKITTTGVSPPLLGTSFSVGFGATGGTPPYTWSATGLPAGVSLSADGTLSGTPSALGTSSVTVTVTDANKQTAFESISLAINLPAAPGVSFNGLPANGTAGTQSSTPITFSGVYPVDVTVKLTLTFAPAAGADDPNIQFSTGGRSATVTLKAGSTTSLTTVGVQTGTVAGVITVTAQLTAANGADITPSPAPVRTITIAPAAPTISSVTATTNSTGFSITVVGFDPTRSITQATFTFTPAVGSTLQTTTVTVPVQTLFTAWYQSSASAPFGSQFSFTLPFSVSGSVSGIASVTVTLTNPTGTSSSTSAPL